MASIIIQVSKYIILFLFLGYIFGAFYVFRYGKQPEKQKIIYHIQKVFLFAIHGLGYLCLYLQDNNTELVGFYLMQVVLLCIIFMFYHFMYKRCSVLLLNNMCMLLVIGMIMQTRLSFDKAFRQFIFIAIGSVIMLIIPLFLQKVPDGLNHPGRFHLHYRSTPKNCFARMPTKKDTTATPMLIPAISTKRERKGWSIATEV